MENGEWKMENEVGESVNAQLPNPFSILHFPFSIQYLEQVDSTNTYLASIADTVQSGHLIWAGHQHNGRGQRGTAWQANPGENLTFSFLLSPTELPLANVFALTQCVALALAAAIAAFTKGQVQPQIKWPNDIVLNGQKLAGILIENRLQGERLAASIAGIGLNVNQTSFGDLPATSLHLLTGHKTENLANFFPHLSAAMGEYYPQLASATGRQQLSLQYHQRLYPALQEWANYATEIETFEAKTLQVADTGHLWLERRSGTKQAFEVKEVKLMHQL